MIISLQICFRLVNSIVHLFGPQRSPVSKLSSTPDLVNTGTKMLRKETGAGIRDVLETKCNITHLNLFSFPFVCLVSFSFFFVFSFVEHDV